MLALTGADALAVPESTRVVDTQYRHAVPTRNSDTQLSDRQAGTTPLVPIQPRVGFSPTTLFNPAGTRPEPAVSVPSAKLAQPVATATAEPELLPPELLPPGTWAMLNGLTGTP